MSCNNIAPKDITIIDGVKLGSSLDGLNSQCDSLKVQQKVLYTKAMFKGSDNIESYRMKFHFSDIFNSSNYNGSSQTLQHYGLYYPIVANGTKNLTGLNVLLVYTSNAYLVSSNENTSDISKETNISGISQNMSCMQIESIANMLSEKYGKPSRIFKNENLNFYVFENNQLKVYSSDSSNIGEMLMWKTKYLDIQFFKGIASGTETYNSKNHSYLVYFDYNPFRNINYELGERPCYSYSYISYQLNDLAMKELGLGKVKL
jgi:hypothetical protein